jgi:hypothetical protein
VTCPGPGVRVAAAPALRLHDRRDPWLRIRSRAEMTFPALGQPGHGRTAFVRRRPVRIVAGCFEGGYADAFELICPDCGDNPYVDYFEAPARLQWLRGPFTLQAALQEYDEHLGPLPGPNGDSAGS